MNELHTNPAHSQNSSLTEPYSGVFEIDSSNAPNDEYVVTTFPIGARGYRPKLGLMVTSLVADVISRRHDNVTSIPAFNVLDSYKDRSSQLEPLMEAHNKLGIDISNAWIDVNPNNRRRLMEDIRSLANMGFLKEEIREVLSCDEDCLRVEMLADAPSFPVGRVYSKNQTGELVCNICQIAARPSEADVLTMTFPTGMPIPTVYPNIMQKDFDELGKRLQGVTILASRMRNTGIVYEGDHKAYNLDVDFFWMNFLSGVAMGKKGAILAGSNHVRRHLMTIAGLFFARNVRTPDRPEVGIIMPTYITKVDGFDSFVNGDYLGEDDPNALRLLVLSSLSWLKDGKWNASAYAYIKRRLHAVDWMVDSRTSVQNLRDIYSDCEQIRGANLSRSLRDESEVSKFLIRGAITGDK